MELKDGRRVAYGVIFDNLQYIDAVKTRRLTNLYGLLYESLLFSDSWLYTNPSLQKLVFSREGAELFRQRILLPFRRDNIGSFDALRSSVISKNMYGLTERTLNDAGMGAELDRIIADNFVAFPLSEVGATFKKMSAEVFKPQFLIRLGFSEEEAVKALQVMEETKGQDNSVIVNAILRLFTGDQARANFIIEVSRAPYVLNLPNIFKTGLIGPEGFRGDRILSALYSSSSVAMLDVETEVGVAAEGYFGVIEDPFANWLLQPWVLESLTAEELAIGRANSDFQEYLNELPVFLSETEPGQFFSSEKKRQWERLFSRLERHLAIAGEDVFRAQLTASKLGVPREGSIKVEGARTIRIFAPQKPLELHGYAPAQTITVDQVRVVGREIHMPKITPDE